MHSQFIQIKLKETQDLDWTHPLQRYFKRVYGSSDEYLNQINQLNKLRSNIVSNINSSINEQSKINYYKYFGQLELLDLRLPFNDNGVHIKFNWSDAYNSNKSYTQHTLPFEKASVLFNLASILSTLAIESFENNNFKNSIQNFQYSAGIYKFIQDNFLNAPSIDLNLKTIEFLYNLSLAQAQEIFLINLLNNNNGTINDSLVAKLSSSTNHYYEKINELYNEDLEFGDEYNWLTIIRFKFQFYQGLSYYHYAKSLESKKIGQSIAYLQLALDSFQHLKKFDTSIINLEYKPYIELIQENLKTSIKENDFIYNESIPLKESLDKIKPLDSVKPININDHSQIGEIVGDDIFEKIIPVNIHEKLSLYSEEKAQILRDELNKLDISNKELESFLEDNNIDELVKVFKNFENNKIIDDELLKTYKYVSNSKFKDIDENNSKIESLKSEISTKIKQIELNLSNHQELIDIKKSLIEASKIDSKISIHRDDLKLFQNESLIISTFSNINNNDLLDLDDSLNNNSKNNIIELEKTLKDLNNIKFEKFQTSKDLKTKIHEDDISNILILNSKNLDSKNQSLIFKQELIKFQPLITRLDELSFNQTKLISKLKSLIDKFFQNKKFSEMFVKYINLSNFKDTFVNYEINFEKSLSFYNDLIEILNELSLQSQSAQPSQIQYQPPPPPQHQQQQQQFPNDDDLMRRFQKLSTSSNHSGIDPLQRSVSYQSNSSSISNQQPYPPTQQQHFQPPKPQEYQPPKPQEYQQYRVPTPPKPQEYLPQQPIPQQYQQPIPQQYQQPTPNQYQYQQPTPQHYQSSSIAPVLPPKPSSISSNSGSINDFYKTPPVFDNSMYAKFSQSQQQEPQQPAVQNQPKSFTKPYDPTNPYN
ncbi:hypothetical protein WICMUC_000215 [Wickerhamomyces mucosus]|uniref:BRO domain-containing protein 1 n=1 Tax=Wickerhamomyces mucosus TaxID=1378264 RepID=A0A9P8TIC6_9ASCO|nr:hypothetical protein WICMUC_000215 [Wickerhamomyces mucosus]